MSIKLYKLVYLYTRKKIKFCKVNVQRDVIPQDDWEKSIKEMKEVLNSKK